MILVNISAYVSTDWLQKMSARVKIGNKLKEKQKHLVHIVCSRRYCEKKSKERKMMVKACKDERNIKKNMRTKYLHNSLIRFIAFHWQIFCT